MNQSTKQRVITLTVVTIVCSIAIAAVIATAWICGIIFGL